MLESLDEQGLDPGMGFLLHPQRDIEVFTYIREGAVTQEDPSGKLSVLDAGACHRAGARSGTKHQAFNKSRTDYAHAFQCCFALDRTKVKSRAEQKRFSVAERKGLLRLMASPDGKGGSLRLHQDVRIYSSLLDPGHHLIHELASGRAAWLHVVKGRIQLIDHGLRAGDGAALVDEAAVSLTAREPSEILLFDLA